MTINKRLNHVSLFSGYGGLDLGLKMAIPNLRTICYCEYDRYAQGVLISRMRDGGLDPAPIWTDIRTLDGRCWRGCVDIISGGFPCQDVSIANQTDSERGIIEGNRSGLWFEYSRLIGEIRPSIVFIENVAMLALRGLTRVISDLAANGYNAKWATVSCAEIGGVTRRQRIFILANLDGIEFIAGAIQKEINPKSIPQYHSKNSRSDKPVLHIDCFGRSYKPIPDYSGMDVGSAFTMDRIKCLGNGVVPQQAALAFQILSERINP